MSRPADNLIGRNFGDLEVTARHGSNKHGHAIWLCKCICGTEKLVSATNLKTGMVGSCGCSRRRPRFTMDF